MEFFGNYEQALQLELFVRDRVYDLDETGILTVVQAPNDVAQLGT
jgi:hypothetical protein